MPQGVDQMELEDVVFKMIGPVCAVGDSHEDAKRLANLKELTRLTDRLLLKIPEASGSAGNHQASMKAIGEHAKTFLQEYCK